MRSTNPLFFYSPLILQTAIWPIVRPLFWFFLRLKIAGLENLKNLPKGVIFASNHTSELDPILIPASLPFLSRFMPMFYVSRPRGFYQNSGWRQVFYGGFFFKLWGAHSAVSGHKNYGVSLSPHIRIIQHRRTVLFFPEGRKTKNGRVMLNEAHGGAAFLAEKTGLPIVPICVSGLYNITLKDFFLRRRRVSVTFGKPIYARELFADIDAKDNRYRMAVREILKIISEAQELSFF
jgi:1-acyl-sn-glycerol-3-phosphate acyltransferase